MKGGLARGQLNPGMRPWFFSGSSEQVDTHFERRVVVNERRIYYSPNLIVGCDLPRFHVSGMMRVPS